VKTGYTFAGWNTQADGLGTNFTEGQNLTSDITITQGATVELFAKWTENLINLTTSSFTGSGVTYANNVFTIQDGAVVRVTGSNTGKRLTAADGASGIVITLDGASLTGGAANPLSLGSGANVTLLLRGTNTLTGSGSPDIEVGTGTLTILSATSGANGTLNANGNGSGQPGIHTTNGVLFIKGGNGERYPWRRDRRILRCRYRRRYCWQPW